MKQLRKFFKITSIWLARIIAIGACGFISVYLLLSGYESIYNRPLPFVHTIDTVNLTAFAQIYNLGAASGQNTKLYGNFGKPLTIKLPLRSLRLDIVPPLQEGDSGIWLARSNTMHLLIPAQPRSGNIGVALLYCRSSFRTLNSQNLPGNGENIFMDTDASWRYIYKVTSAKIYADTEPYIPTDDGTNGQLIIDCNNKAQHLNTVVEASLLAVQGVEQ